MNKKEILNELLNILKKYLKINIIFGENYEEDRLLFRGILNKCLTLKGIDKNFYILQDKLLKIELNEKTIISAKNLSKNTAYKICTLVVFMILKVHKKNGHIGQDLFM